jgi:hypothetical protein
VGVGARGGGRRAAQRGAGPQPLFNILHSVRTPPPPPLPCSPSPHQVAKLFMKDAARFPRDADVTAASGIASLLPGSSIQEFCFEPCGYSMNGLLFDAYWTIHITPESHCSYASFETNVRLKDYAPLVKAVLGIFRPKRFTQTLFADEAGLAEMPGGVAGAFPMVLTAPLPAPAPAAPASPAPAPATCVELPDGSTQLPARAGGDAPLSPRAAARALNYVQTHKSASSFYGYSSLMANYFMVHVAETDGAEVDAVAAAATSLLKIPRAAYILPLCVSAARKRFGSVSG